MEIQVDSERGARRSGAGMPGLGIRLKLLLGTPRRFYLNVFRPGYVRKKAAQREGSCRRCGACCRLVVKCVFFHLDHGLPACRLYKIYRPANCSRFPLDDRDIADRDLVSPDVPCGFWWPAKENAGERGSQNTGRLMDHADSEITSL